MREAALVQLTEFQPDEATADALADAAFDRLADALRLPPAPRRDFVRWQARAQQIMWANQHPGAVDLAVVDDGVLLGRVLVDRTDGICRIVDLVILPAGRRRQAAVEVLQALQAEGRPIVGTVLADNPGLAVFRHLGVQVVEEQPPFVHVRWDPVPIPAAPTP